MWLAYVVQFLAVAALPPDPAAGSAPAATDAICTRQALFAIPFRIDRPDRVGQEPVQVQLYVSGDRGGHWDFYSKVDPASQHFMFRAGTDGEYWFNIRTTDRSGQTRPSGPAAPGLKVVVDTTPPRLRFEARRGEVGQITASFQIDEPYLKRESFTLQYRTGPNAAWQPVPTGPQDIHSAGATHTGEVTWWPPAGVTIAEMRAEVSDMAGNPAVSLAKVASGESRPATTMSVTPSRLESGRPLPPPSASQPTAQRTDDAPSMRIAEPSPAREAWKTASADAGATRWPAEKPDAARTQISLSIDGHKVEDSQPGSVAIRINPSIGNQYAASDNKNAGANDKPANKPADEGLSAADSPARGPDVGRATPPEPAVVDQVTRSVPPTSAAATPKTTSAAGTDASEQRMKVINTKTFELEYSADSVGPSGVGRVELWGTRDGGQTWRKFATGEARENPMIVTVDEEGQYGFRLVVQNRLGRGGKRPQRGDPPEISVGVDLTKPTAMITGAQQGQGADANKLTIFWQAGDNQKLAPRPISLSYRDRNGNWTSIANNLENTGRYVWTFDDRLLQRFELRLEVRDEAGNIALSEMTQPVSLAPAPRP